MCANDSASYSLPALVDPRVNFNLWDAVSGTPGNNRPTLSSIARIMRGTAIILSLLHGKPTSPWINQRLWETKYGTIDVIIAGLTTPKLK